MDDYITISDDEDIECVKEVVNIEPVLIDLTNNDSPFETLNDQEPTKIHPRSQRVDSENSRTEFHTFPEPEPEPEPRSESDSCSPPTLDQSHPDPKPETNQQSRPLSQPNQELPQAEPAPPSLAPVSAATRHPQPGPQEEPPKKPTLSDRELMLAQKALGNEKYRHNLLDDAVRVYRRANELAIKLKDTEMSSILHFNLAMTYCKLGSFDQAIDECAQAVKLNCNYVKAHLKRAEIFQRQRKYEEAVICYEHLVELDSTNIDYARLLEFSKEAVKRMRKKDHYHILGLGPNYTNEDLKKAYRMKALAHHPDRHSDADIVTRRIHEKYFKDASEAHGHAKLGIGLMRHGFH